MNKYVILCEGRPSNALQAMINGLKASKNYPNFQIVMLSYGEVSPDYICYGCAATCTIAQLTDIDLLGDTEWEHYYSYSVEKFEMAINEARQGYLPPLLKLFERYQSDDKRILEDIICNWSSTVRMSNHNWEDQLHIVQKLVNRLRKLGY